MARHRHVPVLAILGRLGITRGSRYWATRCRDGDGRRTVVFVRLGFGFVALESPSFGLLYLSPVEAGRLRAVLRRAIVALGELGGERLPERPPAANGRPAQRRALLLPVPRRHTVAEVLSRVEDSRAVQRRPVPDESVIPRPRSETQPVHHR